MREFYLDESGELGFSENSSRFMLIAILEANDPKRLKNALRKEKKKLHDMGWPKNLEIKGTSLYGSHRNERISADISNNRVAILEKIIRRILSSNVRPSYFVVRKNRLADHLKAAPYGIVYNYFTGCVFCRIHNNRVNDDMSLVVDQRNKETHAHMTFGGYLQTKLVGECGHRGEFTVSHEDSEKRLGLQAVDFISWGLFRNYEHNDDTYKNIIAPQVDIAERWYI